MTAHKHAHLMLQYAQDAMETDKPWERWEVKTAADVQPNVMFQGMSFHPEWYVCNEYRRKPQIIKVTVNSKEMEFPKPITNGIDGDFIYVLDKSNPTETQPFRVIPLRFRSNDFCSDWYLKNGLAHHTKEAAQAHADVLNAICKGNTE